MKFKVNRPFCCCEMLVTDSKSVMAIILSRLLRILKPHPLYSSRNMSARVCSLLELHFQRDLEMSVVVEHLITGGGHVGANSARSRETVLAQAPPRRQACALHLQLHLGLHRGGQGHFAAGTPPPIRYIC